MKVLQINVTCGRGSTGVIAVEIAQMLEQQGHSSVIAYGQMTPTYAHTYKIGGQLENKLHGLLHTRMLGEEGTGTFIGTLRFIRWIKHYKPDIIQIHNLHSNYLNYRLFFRFLKKTQIPVVWSFFDCWPITGKCTHFTESGCRRWETGCHECPQLKTSGPITWYLDRTKKMYEQKKARFTALNLNIIVCSRWLESEVKRSFLHDKPIHMIYNWIDMSKFGEIKDDNVFQKYGLDPIKKTLVSVSANWDDQGTRFTDAVRLAEILPSDYQLVLIGKKVTNRPLLPNMVHVNFVNGVEELSKLYSTAMVFVGFSVEDTFGKVFAESMLCGTPAVVFNATACPEVVGDTGYAVEPHNVEQMLACIEEIARTGKEHYSLRCKEKVRLDYSYSTNVGKYIRLYESIYQKE